MHFYICTVLNLMIYIALSGGISKVDAGVKKASLELGVGVTLYHLVASIDEVCSSLFTI